MGVPSRFAIEYPQRALELIRLFEDKARRRDLVGSFGLLAAAAVLTIPYERMKASHFLHDEQQDHDLAVRGHLDLRISDSESKKPSSVRICVVDILTFDGFPSWFELRDGLSRTSPVAQS